MNKWHASVAWQADGIRAWLRVSAHRDLLQHQPELAQPVVSSKRLRTALSPASPRSNSPSSGVAFPSPARLEGTCGRGRPRRAAGAGSSRRWRRCAVPVSPSSPALAKPAGVMRRRTRRPKSVTASSTQWPSSARRASSGSAAAARGRTRARRAAGRRHRQPLDESAHARRCSGTSSCGRPAGTPLVE